MVIVLSGPDTFRSQRRFVQLREAFKTKHDPSGMSMVVVDAAAADRESIRAAVATQGFFSNKRFVGINHYTASAACPPDDLRAILQPFGESNDVIVVIREVPLEKGSGQKRGGRGKAASAGLKIPEAKAELFTPLPAAELQRWILAETKIRGGDITRLAAVQLMQWCEEDMWRLNNELEKLIAYADGKPITPEHVTALIRAPQASDVFALVDAVAQRRRADALKLLTQELRAGTHPLALIALLANHLGVLMNVQRIPAGTGSAQVAKTLGIHPYVATKAVQQAKHFPADQLSNWHHQLVQADETIKSSSIDAEALFDILLAKS